MTDEIEAIRARHINNHDDPEYSEDDGFYAHDDRGVLLRLLDATREELLAICNAAKTALGLLDDPSCPVTGLDETRRARAILAAALKAPPTRAQGESS
jgi:hypothetical protein